MKKIFIAINGQYQDGNVEIVQHNDDDFKATYEEEGEKFGSWDDLTEEDKEQWYENSDYEPCDYDVQWIELNAAPKNIEALEDGLKLLKEVANNEK